MSQCVLAHRPARFSFAEISVRFDLSPFVAIMIPMRQVDAELDRYLTLLGNMIRQRGYTQLEVQQVLGWGRSYISQLVTKQKSLRVEQVLLILEVIGVDAAEFFSELYAQPGSSYAPSRQAPLPVDPGQVDEQKKQLQELTDLMRGLVGLLVERQVISGEELSAAAEDADREP